MVSKTKGLLPNGDSLDFLTALQDSRNAAILFA
jgi:hypothetical protein